MNEPLIRFEENGSFGYHNQSGKIIIDPSFDWASEYVFGNYVWVYIKNDDCKIYCLDLAGNINFSLNEKLEKEHGFNNLIDLWELSDSYLGIQISTQNGKFCGIIDGKGDIIIEPKYKYVEDVFRDTFLVRNGDFFKLIFDNDIIGIDSFPTAIDDWLIITQEGKDGLLNTNSNYIILNTIYDSISNFDDDYFIIIENGKKGLFDKRECSIVLDTIYDSIEKAPSFGCLVTKGENESITGEDDCFIIIKNGKEGLFDKVRNEIILEAYDSIIETGSFGCLVYIGKKVAIFDHQSKKHLTKFYESFSNLANYNVGRIGEKQDFYDYYFNYIISFDEIIEQSEMPSDSEYIYYVIGISEGKHKKLTFTDIKYKLEDVSKSIKVEYNEEIDYDLTYKSKKRKVLNFDIDNKILTIEFLASDGIMKIVDYPFSSKFKKKQKILFGVLTYDLGFTLKQSEKVLKEVFPNEELDYE